MPYEMVKSGNGYKIVKKDTGEEKNKKPISKERASAYMRALYAAESRSDSGMADAIRKKRKN